MKDLEARINAIDTFGLEEQLNTQGWGVIPTFFSSNECEKLAAQYNEPQQFRKRVVMDHHAFGKGEYQYFKYPLPSAVQTLRSCLYPFLVPLANRWRAAFNDDRTFPPTHEEFIERCQQAGQTQATPLMLDYRPGDYNRLHQDLYGEHTFPLQCVFLLNSPGKDFEGGEFVITEGRARMQSRAMVVPLGLGDLLVFGVRERPVPGIHHPVRAALRHGVSEIRSGKRRTLGIIFHDAP